LLCLLGEQLSSFAILHLAAYEALMAAINFLHGCEKHACGRPQQLSPKCRHGMLKLIGQEEGLHLWPHPPH
jgi:hypothetical protein